MLLEKNKTVQSYSKTYIVNQAYLTAYYKKDFKATIMHIKTAPSVITYSKAIQLLSPICAVLAKWVITAGSIIREIIHITLTNTFH